MEKINIAELLKNCPKGMELDCTMFRGLEFDRIDENNGTYPIICRVKAEFGNYNVHTFTKHGYYSTERYSKCVIFPKGKTTWEGFVPPCVFKDGDIAVSPEGDIHLLRTADSSYCAYRARWQGLPKFDSTITTSVKVVRPATEEEKQKLFDAIKENGYKWNAESKTLEKLIEPKFDISTLIPFESRVLVRDYSYGVWRVSFWGCLINNEYGFKYDTIRGAYKQCIPYESNEHLLGKTDDCDEFYKTWE